MNEIREELNILLGPPGRIVSMSKSGYGGKNPKHLVIFNANIVAVDHLQKVIEKVWFGDVDITLDEACIKKIADSCEVELRVLYEMDGRFEHDERPLIDKYVYKYPSEDSEINPKYRDYYERDKDGKLTRRDTK